MTHEDMQSIDERFNGLSSQIKALSSQLLEMKRTMVTRDEYNEAHAPLVAMVQRHESFYVWMNKGRNKLAWIGMSTLLFSVWAAPHWQGIVKMLKALAP